MSRLRVLLCAGIVLVTSTGFTPASLAALLDKQQVLPDHPAPTPRTLSVFQRRVKFIAQHCPVLHPGRVGLSPHYTLQSIVRRASNDYAVPEKLLYSVIAVESNCNAAAVSPVGARGMMQLMPATARWLGVENSRNAADNIRGGAKYLSYLLRRFGHDTELALAAYNAGPRNVDRFGGVPPFSETRTYLRRVKHLATSYDAAIASGEADVAMQTATAPQPQLPNL